MHWWNLYTRERWQEAYYLLGSVYGADSGITARLQTERLADEFPEAEFAYCAAYGTYLFQTEAEGRAKKFCKDYGAFYRNSGGVPPINPAVSAWSIGFDADFSHRLK